MEKNHGSHGTHGEATAIPALKDAVEPLAEDAGELGDIEVTRRYLERVAYVRHDLFIYFADPLEKGEQWHD